MNIAPLDQVIIIPHLDLASLQSKERLLIGIIQNIKCYIKDNQPYKTQ